MNLDDRTVSAWLLLTTTVFAPAALAQSDNSKDIPTATLTGGVATLTPASDRWAHFQGSVGFMTSDYFRGGYDNVEEDLDQLAFTTGLSTTIELMRDRQGPLTDLTLSLGTANNFANHDERPALDEDGHWYESNWYAGLAARLGPDWLGSLTYTAYGVPASDDDPTHEIALAAQYGGGNWVGSLNPQFKVAAPFAAETEAGDDGVFTSFGLTPNTQLGQQSQYPLTLSFPMEIGVGMDDYYGADSSTGRYASIGASATTPLAFVPSSYGNWSITGAIDVLARDDDLRATEPDFADEPVVTSASVSLSVIY